MFFAHCDDVLLEVSVRRKLHKPFFAVKFEWDYADVLSCRHSRIADKTQHVLAKHTFRIARFRFFCKSDLFGCGEVYRDDYFASLAVVLPHDVLFEILASQIQTVESEFAKEVARLVYALVACFVVKHFDDG